MDTEQSLQMIRKGHLWGPGLRGSAAAVPVPIAGAACGRRGGPEGVRRFYDPSLQRRGAFPPPIKLVLFGPGTVHGLDDDEHHTHKAMHLGVLTGARVAELASRASSSGQSASRDGPGVTGSCCSTRPCRCSAPRSCSGLVCRRTRTSAGARTR